MIINGSVPGDPKEVTKAMKDVNVNGKPAEEKKPAAKKGGKKTSKKAVKDSEELFKDDAETVPEQTK